MIHFHETSSFGKKFQVSVFRRWCSDGQCCFDSTLVQHSMENRWNESSEDVRHMKTIALY